MKNLVQIIVGVLLLLVSANALAKKSGDTYFVEMSYPDTPLSTGDTLTITGSIIILDEKGNVKKPPKDLYKKIEFHAFFPDLEQEVTGEVIIDNNLNFTFTSPPLDGADLNIFQFFVGPLSKDGKKTFKN